MFSFSMSELVVILAIALVVFGPAKLPEIGKAIGKGISNFKTAVTSEGDNQKSSGKQYDYILNLFKCATSIITKNSYRNGKSSKSIYL